ncbi:pheromone processing endoprotease [Scheffersomyces spartinae]|uniref:Pheromone processing endoprotease n=1 Tax=Scheffersomyces spartinae TaxID=45513 RepID=A0A9P7V573_9ASCO|nr:pheromone processing endoprotease [Scheffersomyces spartinae]KAG7191586.1 pheromone processing endoprotease [Scheffersomyces spartinae]
MQLYCLYRIAVTLLGCLSTVAHGYQIPPRDYELNNYFIVELKDDYKVHDFIDRHRNIYKFEHQLPRLDNHYVFSIDKKHPHNEFLGNYNSNNYDLFKRDYSGDGYEDHIALLLADVRSIHALPPKQLEKRTPVYYSREEMIEKAAKRDYKINDSSQEGLKKVADQLKIEDPLFIEQWHLINTRYPGHDVNVSGLWLEGIAGKGIVTALVDDGLDFTSPDLKDSFNAEGSWDFNDNGKAPMPRLYDDYHGTRCAGEIAAQKNEFCGIGVAYDSQVAGVRILSGRITAADEAQSLIYGLNVNDIYSCSWGPTDDGRTLAEPEVIVKKAMIKGIQDGRDNKGALYVFALGNGARFGDSCNFDGYTNSIYSITVGAIDYKGLHPSYAEACSAVMVVTYSSGSGEHIHTTDIKEKCSAAHGGTSAAAPLAAGIYSLVLSVNPNLTWRDVQYVSALSAVPVNEEDGSYQVTKLGRKYSHKYGFGKLDAYKMVKFAETWKNVKPQAWYYSDVVDVMKKWEGTKVDAPPPAGGPGRVKRAPEYKDSIILSVISVTEDDLKVMNVERLEHVTVKVNIDSSFRGKVGVKLTSPSGLISELASFRRFDGSGSGFQNWTFMSVAHWGEDGVGDWKLEVYPSEEDMKKVDIGFKNWQLRLWGESIDAEKAEKYDLDVDYSKIRRDRLEAKPIEVSSSAPLSSSTSEAVATSDVTVPTSTSSPSSTATDDSSKEGGTEDSEDNHEGANKQYTNDHTGQYFMAVAILGFVLVIIYMRFHRTPGGSKRRVRREQYEFDIIPGEEYSDSEDEDAAFANERGRRGGRDNSFELGTIVPSGAVPMEDPDYDENLPSKQLSGGEHFKVAEDEEDYNVNDDNENVFDDTHAIQEEEEQEEEQEDHIDDESNNEPASEADILTPPLNK